MSVVNTGKHYVTTRGEVYVKCGIEFGPDPVEVSAADLNRVSKRAGMDRTVGDWLSSDRRLKEVPNPKKKPESESAAESEKPGDKGK